MLKKRSRLQRMDTNYMDFEEGVGSFINRGDKKSNNVELILHKDICYVIATKDIVASEDSPVSLRCTYGKGYIMNQHITLKRNLCTVDQQ